ncbi:mechanosensitive ion channel family protein [Candidatus Micrarchaeota archaeon]|nr:mechanosensitive ion channel family protein [Candidatus Micrarchaeota archaeon]
MLDQLILFIQGILAGYGIEIKEGSIIAFILLLVGLTAVFQLLLMILLRIARFAAGKTNTTLDDEILHVVSAYLPLIALITSFYISMAIVYPSLKLGNFTELQIYLMLMLAVFAFLITGIMDILLVWYGTSIQPAKRKQLDKRQTFPFVRNIIKITLFIIFGIFILQLAGFDTTALITGLGIGGLAVALALQDTLGNFFAGIHILLDKPFKEGDYIVLEGGQEGTIDRIGWRTTKLLTLSSDEIIVPNSKLASSIVKNHSTPHEETGVHYDIGVSYDSDVEKVIETLKGAIKNAERSNENLVKDSGWARLEKYGDYALVFRFGYLVYGYQNKFSVLADVNREIFKEFKKNMIEIPFPTMVVKKHEEKKPKK